METVHNMNKSFTYYLYIPLHFVVLQHLIERRVLLRPVGCFFALRSNCQRWNPLLREHLVLVLDEFPTGAHRVSGVLRLNINFLVGSGHLKLLNELVSEGITVLDDAVHDCEACRVGVVSQLLQADSQSDSFSDV